MARRDLGIGMASALVLTAVAWVVACQLFLPTLAERRVTRDLDRRADGVRVHISASPAVKLLMHRADSVRISIAQLRASGANGVGGGGDVGNLIARTRAVHGLIATIGTVTAEGLEFDEVRITKAGGQLALAASVSRDAIRRRLPSRIQLARARSTSNDMRFTATLRAFGRRVSVTAGITVEDGRIAIRPSNPIARFLRIDLFKDRRVFVSALKMTTTANGYRVAIAGHLT